MKLENRKRMKKIAWILGAISFVIIIWGIYNLFIAK